MDGRTLTQSGLEVRQAAWRRLKDLAAKYQQEGDRGFLDELLHPTSIAAIIHVQSVYEATRSPKAAADRVAEMLSFADVNSKALSAGQ